MKLSRLLDRTRKTFSVPSADPSASKKDLERRRSVRATLDYPVELLDAARRPAGGAVHLTDMSGVGLGISSSRDFRIGDAVGVAFNTQGKVVNAVARVRWARPEGVMTSYGLELEGVGYWDRRRIERLSSPSGLDAEAALSLLLQFGASAMAAGVCVDWVASDPARLQAFLLSLPWLLSVAAGAFIVWAMSRL